MKSLKREDGQSIFLVAVMVMSFIMFFSFTINTGLLIHAKISVQAAADAAAYAGAATQGRLLNSISFLNYDMRRQYKKFLFRNAFVGSMGSPEFPEPANPAGGNRYDFPKYDYSGGPVGSSVAGAKSTIALTVPVICIPMMKTGNSNTSNDYCYKLNSRNTSKDLQVSVGHIPGRSDMMDTLIAAQDALTQMQAVLCQGQGLINQYVALSWAFRGNNDDSELYQMLDKMYAKAQSMGTATSQLLDISQKPIIINQVKSLISGVGLYPKNIFTYLRIKTLVDILNDPANPSITQDDLGSLEGQGDVKERSILAFRSAASNLNTEVFDASKTELQELQPSKLIQDVQMIPAQLDMFIQAMDVSKQPNPNDNTICNVAINQIPLKNVPIGVNLVRTPGKNVVYGVKLKAYVKPKGLFFAPWREPLELDAYAGAKPFGSRTGPVVMKPEDEFFEFQSSITVKVNGDYFCNSTLGVEHKCNVPNMAIGGGRTFFDRQFLDDLMHVAKENGNIITIKGLNKALYYAMAPSSTEVGRYNIIPPPPLKSDGTLDSDVMKYEFIPYTDAATIQAAKSSPDGDPPAYRFYAPIAPKTAGDPKGLITKYLNDTLSGGLPDPRFGITMDDIRDQTKTGMFTYLSKLESGIGTEHGETESFAAVELPIYPPMLPNPPKYAVTSAAQVLSSFGSYVRMPGNTFSNPPRFGYSVRFVSMQDLQKEGLNDPDGEFDQVNH